MIACPHCHGRAIGKVGANHYYCWDCCIEFSSSAKGIEMYRVEDDGTLVLITDTELVAAKIAKGESSCGVMSAETALAGGFGGG